MFLGVENNHEIFQVSQNFCHWPKEIAKRREGLPYLKT